MISKTYEWVVTDAANSFEAGYVDTAEGARDAVAEYLREDGAKLAVWCVLPGGRELCANAVRDAAGSPRLPERFADAPDHRVPQRFHRRLAYYYCNRS